MKRGQGSPNYGTGRTVTGGGYIRVWQPGHPVANKGGYALEHRYVLHEAGVDVPRGSQVHHVNQDKTDNRLENLRVISATEHNQIHADERREKQTHCRNGHEFTAENVWLTREGWRQCRACNRERHRKKVAA